MDCHAKWILVNKDHLKRVGRAQLLAGQVVFRTSIGPMCNFAISTLPCCQQACDSFNPRSGEPSEFAPAANGLLI